MSIARRLLNLGRPFRILAIETSCDDTAVCVLESTGRILSEVNLHQYSIHSKHQGIVPYLATQGHRISLPNAIQTSLSQSNLSLNEIDVIATTRGPGLVGSLQVGYDAGRLLSCIFNKPFYPIHHMEAHLLISKLYHKNLSFPFLCLLISGGHTLLILANSLGNYSQLGSTLDDSFGEAVDKASRTLGFRFDEKVGPAALLVKAATNSDPPNSVLFPIPSSTRLSTSMDFSFSGFKTALSTYWSKLLSKDLNETLLTKARDSTARSFLDGCSDHLMDRLRKARSICGDQLPIVISGGAARNDYTFKRIADEFHSEHSPILRPAPEHCVDNAVMIGWTAIEYIKAELDPQEYGGVIPEWPLQDLKLR